MSGLALGEARCLGSFWMNLQKSYELEVASRRAGAAIERTIKRRRERETRAGVRG